MDEVIYFWEAFFISQKHISKNGKTTFWLFS
jgi:hypothetical protein